MAGVEFLTGDQTGLALYTKSEVQQVAAPDQLDHQPQPSRWGDVFHVAYRALQNVCQSNYVFYPLVVLGLALIAWQIRSWWRMEVVVAKEKGV
jgi:hypothetical protein